VFFVRGGEQVPCPCCGDVLKVIGSRSRKYINKDEEKVVLIIRRLRCCMCHKIHHELPDFLVPYKRYESSSLEAVITGDENISVSAEESTLNRRKARIILSGLSSVYPK
jgi:hypothetical protein